jgi:hypothetical protein
MKSYFSVVMRGSCALALNDKVPVCTITDLKYGRSQDKAVQYSIITLLGGGGVELHTSL